MKRVILSAVFSTLILFAFCGCEGGFLSPKAPDLNKKYCFCAEISTPSGSYTADFLRNDTDDWVIDFTAPFTVANMAFQVKSGDGLATYDGTQTQMSAQSWNKSLLSAVIIALEAAANNPQGLAVTTIDGGLQAAGVTQDMNFLLIFNGDGKLCGLSIDAIELKAEISDIEILGDVENNDIIGVD